MSVELSSALDYYTFIVCLICLLFLRKLMPKTLNCERPCRVARSRWTIIATHTRNDQMSSFNSWINITQTNTIMLCLIILLCWFSALSLSVSIDLQEHRCLISSFFMVNPEHRSWKSSTGIPLSLTSLFSLLERSDSDRKHVHLGSEILFPFNISHTIIVVYS